MNEIVLVSTSAIVGFTFALLFRDKRLTDYKNIIDVKFEYYDVVFKITDDKFRAIEKRLDKLEESRLVK